MPIIPLPSSVDVRKTPQKTHPLTGENWSQIKLDQSQALRVIFPYVFSSVMELFTPGAVRKVTWARVRGMVVFNRRPCVARPVSAQGARVSEPGFWQNNTSRWLEDDRIRARLVGGNNTCQVTRDFLWKTIILTENMYLRQKGTPYSGLRRREVLKVHEAKGVTFKIEPTKAQGLASTLSRYLPGGLPWSDVAWFIREPRFPSLLSTPAADVS